MSAQLFTSRRRAPAPAPVSETWAPQLGPRGREALALLLFAGAVCLVLGLASLRMDPSDARVRGADWIGPVGASAAGTLVTGFGIVAWLAPIELLLLATPLVRRRPPGAAALRFSGDVIVMVIISALVHVAAPEAVAFGQMPAGGNVGFFFGELLQAFFSTIGSFLVGTTIVFLILIGRSSVSLIEFTERMQRVAGHFGTWAVAGAEKIRNAWHEARLLRREARAREREARGAAPAIDENRSDEAILAHLDEDDSDWIPLEQTGAPPLALSKALRESLEKHGGLLETDSLDDDVEPPLAPSVLDEGCGDTAGTLSTSAPTAASKVPRAARKKHEPAEPRIVDTRPNQQIERGKKETIKRPVGFNLPPTDILHIPETTITQVDRDRVLELADKLEKTLADYGVTGKVVEIHPGPTVTTYEVTPEAGTKVSRIANLSDDLALGLSRKVRIIAPIPGKSRIGFELPNDARVPVNLRELVEDKRFDALSAKAPLPVVLGRDIVGAPFYADLASMPHVIVAGATGAGKSVGLNVMLSSLLFRRTPDELRLLMIDPKVVELAPFDGIPHMLLPVVTDMKQAATALKWAVDEMERRYQLFANAGTKNITTYNRWAERIANGELPIPDLHEVNAIAADGEVVSVPATKEGSDGRSLPGKLPYIVVVVDEFADLMMQQGKEVESSVARLAQKARAAGMHVVLATQRPSVDVITGMIKANFPTRVAYRVAQKVDSRTILDEQGAELLLGKGDMLVKMNGSNETRRVQCPFISEDEVNDLTDFLRKQGTPEYHDAILRVDEEQEESDSDEVLDPRFDEAVRIVAETRRCSTSWLQRKMTVGYNRAAKMVEAMERRGMVGPPNGARDREVLLPAPS